MNISIISKFNKAKRNNIPSRLVTSRQDRDRLSNITSHNKRVKFAPHIEVSQIPINAVYYGDSLVYNGDDIIISS
jgi:hypothetical protein